MTVNTGPDHRNKPEKNYHDTMVPLQYPNNITRAQDQNLDIFNIDNTMPCYKEKNTVHQVIDSGKEGKRHPNSENIIAVSSVDDLFLVKIEKEENKEDKEAGPLDGGYGWVIVFGSFLTHVLIGGFERGGGIFFLKFLERYGKSNQLTSWPLSLTSSMFLWFGPVASAVCSRYSARASLMVGGLMMTVGLILTSFSNNFYVLFLYFTLIYGIGIAFCYAPSLIIVNMYFNKRRSRAAGLASSGVGVGTFALVPLLQFLFDTYGFSGAFLILGGITLNMNLIAMLFRPLSLHHRFTKIEHVKILYEEEAAFSLSELKNSANNMSRSNTYTDHHSQKPEETRKCTSPNTKSPSCFKSSIEIIFPIEKCSKNSKIKNKLCDFSLLNDVPFSIYCFSICLFTLAFKSGFIFLPALMKSKGLSEDSAALVISLSGISDMISRILTGVLLDHDKLRPFRTFIYNSFMFLVAGIAFILPSLHNFWSFVIITCTYSLFTGAYVSQKSVIVVDILGIENMANSFGLLIFFQGFGTLIGPPLSGFLKDQFGTYDGAIYLGGSCMFIASILMILCNIFLKLRQKSKTEAENIDITT